MARAHSIYVIINRYEPGIPLAAFTVKHEAKYWLRQQGNVCGLEVTTLRDGGGGTIKLRERADLWIAEGS